MGRYLGQHFLINKRQLRKFVEALELKTDDTVVEIGPGHGELTLLLARNFQFSISNFQIIAIEKDLKLVKGLKFKIQNLGIKNIEVIQGDALKILPKLTESYKLKTKNYKIVGNIPFAITGMLLRILGELENKPSLVVLIIQKEVAQRICAEPPKMNLLAASVQFWAKPEIISYISKRDFRPAPKVDSAIIALTPIYADNKQINAEKYYKLIKALFKQPRKTILNNLRDAKIANTSECHEKLKKININPQDRPQNLSLEQLIELSKTF